MVVWIFYIGSAGCNKPTNQPTNQPLPPNSPGAWAFSTQQLDQASPEVGHPCPGESSGMFGFPAGTVITPGFTSMTNWKIPMFQ